MSQPAVHATVYQVARSGGIVYVRVQGLANMKNVQVLDSFIGAEIEGATTLCIDLSACTGMDSTFMGLMVGTSQRLKGQQGRLVLVNPTEANLRLLRMLGVSDVVPVIGGSELPALEFINLSADPNLGPMQRMEIIRRAHQSLVALNEANRAKFATFLEKLEADLAKLPGKPG
jgi:anti-anti-sigma factor